MVGGSWLWRSWGLHGLNHRCHKPQHPVHDVRLAPWRAISFTIALPTTTASALAATVRACAGVEMPKPTAIGRSVVGADLRGHGPRASATLDCMPVTPSRETQ